MKNLKKVLGLLVALVVAVSCAVVPAFAAGSISVSAERKTADPGDTVTVAVSVSEASFAGYSMKLSYDTDALTLVSIAKNAANNPGLFSANADAGSAKCGTVSLINDADSTISGTLFTATFRVADNAAPGTYSVTLSDVSFAEADRERLSVSASNGSITVNAPHVHSYTDKVYPPSCTEKGYTEHTCACGDSYKDTWVPEKGHAYTDKIVGPTCAEKGYTLHTCACGHNFKDTWVEQLKHKYTDKNVAPDCTDKGYTLHTCSVCGSSYKDGWVDAKGHKLTKPAFQWKDDYSACKASYSCSVCGETFDAECQVAVETKEATTNAKGKITYTATVTIDGKEYKDVQTVELPKLDPAPVTPSEPGNQEPEEPKSNAGLWVVIGFGLAGIILFVIFFIKKKKEKKN